MPYSQMIYKAGKLSFLLVCLFLCTACKDEKTQFLAGDSPEIQVEQEQISENERLPDQEISDPQMVNINTADAQTLMTLPGIGEVRAKAIIEYRQQVGKFEKIEDIMNVKGIKTGTFSKINSLICVK